MKRHLLIPFDILIDLAHYVKGLCSDYFNALFREAIHSYPYNLSVRPSIITLTTDFGNRDSYVAAMKGTILGINPAVHLIDISHEIASQDIMEAAFVLTGTIPFFPKGTIHLVVVDPGVGTERKPIALRHQDQVFVGPDNGLFSLLVGDQKPDELVALSNSFYWRSHEPSTTFHGRDIFAPVAAHISNGVPLHLLGNPAQEIQHLKWVQPIADDQGLRGWVVHIDHFGNCITNISQELLEKHSRGRNAKFYIGSVILKGLKRTYGSVAHGEPLVLTGSSGCLEVAVNAGNASDLFGIKKGAPVSVVFSDK